jgi:hypothetical protein
MRMEREHIFFEGIGSEIASRKEKDKKFRFFFAPYTLHYKIDKPKKDGLFCKRIFRSIKMGFVLVESIRAKN